MTFNIVFGIIYRFSDFTFKPIEIIGRASYNIFLTQLVYYNNFYRNIIRWTDNIWVRVLYNVIVCVLIGTIFYLIEGKITNRIIEGVEKVIKNYLRKFGNV